MNKSFLLAGAFGAFAFGVASSAIADAVDPVVVEPAAIAAPQSPVVDWNGFYIGAVAGSYTEAPVSNPDFGFVGGYNYVTGKFLFGAEAGALRYDINTNCCLNVQGTARAGYLINDTTVVYALAGAGQWTALPVGTSPWGPYTLLGAGAEFAFSDRMSVRGEYRKFLWPSSSFQSDEVRIGIILGFN